MIDVKKLVVGFLVLAVATSASALLISNLGGSSAAANDTALTADAGLTAQAASPATGNAFLPQQADPNAGDVALFGADTDPTLASSTDAISSDPNNLTNILANAYLNNLALTNPSGPATDSSGNPTLTPPDPNSVLAQFENSSTAASIQVPNWDTEANEIPVTITSSSASALAAYGAALDGILNGNIVQTNLQSMLDNNPDPSFEPYVEGKVQTALRDISGLQTPAPAAALQKSLIKTLVYAKNSLALAEGASADPLKTELVLEAEGVKYDAAVQDLQTQLQNAQSQNLFSIGAAAGTGQANPNRILANIQAILGIPTAHAVIPVVDFITHLGVWTTVAHMIKAEIQDITLQIVKNTIVFAMQKTIFAAIKGSGAPAFIQQWGNALANAFQASALSALNSQMACVGAAPFAPQLRLTLKATYSTNNNACAVQFNNQLANNLSKFYSSFSNGGGWVTFGSTMQPDNNYYGSVFFAEQTIGNTAQNAQNAAQAKSIANQGFHGSAVCADGSNPNTGSHYDCGDGTSDVTASTICRDDSPPDLIPNNGACANGANPQVQTPGTVFNNMVGSAVDGNFKLITSANNWAGLASGLFVSIMQEILNSLAQTTIADANGLLQQASAGGGATSVGTGAGGQPIVTQTASSAAQLTCIVSPDPSGNPFMADLSMDTSIGAITATGVSTPSYVWTPPAGGTLSAATGADITATFNATGTYQVVVNDIVDNASQTCTVSVPTQ